MKKSLFKLISLGLVTTLFLAGCNDFLDVNNNPNSAEEVPVDLQVTPLIAGFSQGMDDGFPGRVSANWTKQISNNGDIYYYNLSKYQLGQPWFAFNDTWNTAYTQVAKNARVAYQKSEELGYNNYEGVSKLVFVWTMSMMTDLYGPIPYSEAFDPANQSPSYDSQEQIYPELMTLLDEAISALEEGGPRTLEANQDLLYGGDMQKWTRLAYTLKARFLMRLTEAPDGNKQQRASNALTALSNGLQSNADNAEFQYYDQNDARNPWYTTIEDTENEFMQMSANYIDILKSLSDPRLPIHAQEAEVHEPGEPYIGHENGAAGTLIDSVSSIGSAFAGADAPNRLLDYAEAKFLEAQALLITQGAGAANSPYREAIRADMEDLGVSDSEINTYLADRDPLTAVNNPLEYIVNQKYIANFLNPEAYNDWRKTGYPELDPALFPDGNDPNFNSIPRRYPWAGSELSNNAESIQELNLPLNFQVMQEKVWWDTR